MVTNSRFSVTESHESENFQSQDNQFFLQGK